MSFYKYIEMSSLQLEDIVVLENIYFILNEKWDYEKVEETKEMTKMFEDSEEVIAQIMSIKEIDVRNKRTLTFLPLTKEEKRLGMIENPEKWIAEIDVRQESIGFLGIGRSLGSNDTSISMERCRALAKFLLKIAVYRFCTVHWPKLVSSDKTIDKKRIKVLIEGLESWERNFWIDPIQDEKSINIFMKRKEIIPGYTNYYEKPIYVENDFAKYWIQKAYKANKDKPIYENAKKMRLKYIENNRVVERKDDSSHKVIPEIESMRNLLDIMERHLSNNLTPQDTADLKENMQDWEKNTEKLSEMIGNLSGF